MTPFAPPVEPPAEPITDEVCQHCQGVGWVDGEDVDSTGYGATARPWRCDACDGVGLAPADADAVCACDHCLSLPRDQRVGSLDADPPEDPR